MGINLMGKRSKLAFILIFVIAVVALVRVVQITKSLNETKHSLATLTDNLKGYRTIQKGVIDSLFAEEKVVVDPVNSVVYLPEFKVKLPYNDVTKSIAYSMRNDSGIGGVSRTDPPEADVTSTFYIAPEQPTVIDCSDFLRLRIEKTPNPFNANEKLFTVMLKDGRRLQVYELINEKECTNSWNNSISPATLAAEFKQATSY